MRKSLAGLLAISCILIFTVSALAVSNNNFVLNIIHDDSSMREIDSQIAIPFNTEYSILMKNNHARRCSVKVWIDGTLANKLGDFIVSPNREFELERFVTDSLTKGKKFKFVPLDNPDVQDPSNPDNGLIRVEFRLERKLYIIEEEDYEFPWEKDNEPPWGYWYKDGEWFKLEDGEELLIPFDYNTATECENIVINTDCSTAPGATIPGEESNQTFRYVEFEGEEEVTVLELRLVGIVKK